MVLSEIADMLGLAGTGADGIESVMWLKKVGIALKLIAVIFEFVCESITLHNNRMDLVQYESNSSRMVNSRNQTFNGVVIYVNYKNETLNATLNVETFRTSFYAYAGFYALQIAVSVSVFTVQMRRILKKKDPIPFLWIPVALFVELPLLSSETFLLKTRGIIDWHDQKWDMLLHVIFILNLPFQTIVDLWTVGDKSWSGFCLGLFISPFCFLLGCMVYTPISVIMVGFKGFDRITLEDFGKIILIGVTKDIMLILAEIGHIGQWIWSFIILMTILYCVINAKKDK